jgi:hypothetical protein
MKIEIDIIDDNLDKIVVYEMKTIINVDVSDCWNDEDAEHMREVVAAAKVIYGFYGGDE